MGVRPYSLRRGGATAYYRATRNMAATIERGQWSSLRVARLYINDGAAKEVELRIEPSVETQLMSRARALKTALEKGKVGQGPPSALLRHDQPGRRQ